MLDDSPGLGSMEATDHPRAGTSWDDFCSARARFLARLAELSEISRLERAWALQAHTRSQSGESRPYVALTSEPAISRAPICDGSDGTRTRGLRIDSPVL